MSEIPDVQGGEYLKEDTKEILKELQAEGHTLEGITPKEESTEEAKVEPVKTEEPKPEAEPEPEKVETPAKPEKVEREVQAVPVKKYNEERHKRQEAEKRAQELETQLKEGKPVEVSSDVKTVASQFAQKYGIENTEFIEELLTTATKLNQSNTQGLSAEEIAALKQAKTVLDQQKEEQAFQADFDKVTKDLSEKGIDVTGHKDKIKQLAYTEGYTSTSLRAIALEYAHDNGLLTKGKKTLEKSSGGRTTTTEAIDFDSLSDEQAKALPDDQWEKFVEHQIAKQNRERGVVKHN